MPFDIVIGSTSAREQRLDIGWPHAVPPAGAVLRDNPIRNIVFADTGGLCDMEEVFGLTRRMIATVDETLVRFERFFRS